MIDIIFLIIARLLIVVMLVVIVILPAIILNALALRHYYTVQSWWVGRQEKKIAKVRAYLEEVKKRKPTP